MITIYAVVFECPRPHESNNPVFLNTKIKSITNKDLLLSLLELEASRAMTCYAPRTPMPCSRGVNMIWYFGEIDKRDGRLMVI